ncbi:hypothetical protein A3D77_07420 [Candidatus Gottesmanbacteria bacterium RIFCSPHIGHO2_02_FULL_39_11]|uniref:Glucosyltransferase 3-like C-terminal domain-containing protein n=1 Tax=Candidatus Gottesmanbacteria bacterium RIFCSPHIGHO2_02_FULL_39_11 TaxID=1798382 RepID=A0A1F5ZK56_9BACT|nr:MAG: hypothetical protein A3D77_07420 [Candidatus Gottesmanbacteria bacterium RIFCSPHIGHO2_02_FULL_39_11]
MKRVLIIYPYGNINHNPNLSAIVTSLEENGYYTDILSPRFPTINQNFSSEKSSQILIDDSDKNNSNKYIKAVNPDNYSLVIGIDKGIIPASKIAGKAKVSYGLISYEIIFRDEIGFDAKKDEIEACSGVSFAVCQDNIRSLLLSEENTIPLNKIINIPVAGKYKSLIKKSDHLRKTLGIGNDKRIALYAGSLSSWGMIDSLIEQVNKWPNDWVLVLHPRYGIENRILKYINKIKKNSRVYLSDTPVDTTAQMDKIVSSVDLGIALYKSDPNHPALGKNILFIGLSSGKISTYLNYGIPVMINEIGQMTDYVRKYKLGIVVENMEKANPSKFDYYDSKKLSSRCINFFKSRLDFALYEKSLISIIKAAVQKKKITVSTAVVDNYMLPQSTIEQMKALYKDYLEVNNKFQKLKSAGINRIFDKFNSYNNLL